MLVFGLTVHFFQFKVRNFIEFHRSTALSNLYSDVSGLLYTGGRVYNCRKGTSVGLQFKIYILSFIYWYNQARSAVLIRFFYSFD